MCINVSSFSKLSTDLSYDLWFLRHRPIYDRRRNALSKIVKELNIGPKTLKLKIYVHIGTMNSNHKLKQ